MFEKQGWNGGHFIEGLKLGGVLSAFHEGNVFDINFMNDAKLGGEPGDTERAGEGHLKESEVVIGEERE